MKFLPYGRQDVDENDIEAVVAALKSDFLTTGPRVEALEADLAETLGAAHVVTCSSGTAALHLALLAAGIGPGDHVVVPTITFVATANAARLCGAEVVFADVDPATGLMDAAALEAALARSPDPVKAIMPVHYAGQTVRGAPLAARAAQAGAVIVEDACHAIGSRGEDGPVGACRHSTATAFSFHPVKTVTSAEGGAVATGDAALAARMRLLRNHGLTRAPEDFVDTAAAFAPDGSMNGWYYEMHMPGLNYRLADVNCALLSSQLDRLPAFASRRARLMAQYRRLLAPLAPQVVPLAELPGQEPCWHLAVALVDFDAFGLTRQAVMAGLRALGIGSQVHYAPVHRQPYYRARYGDVSLPGAEEFYRRVLSLPLFPAMRDEDVERVVAGLRQVLENGG